MVDAHQNAMRIGVMLALQFRKSNGLGRSLGT
jgi:hypothetical protein